MKDKRTHIELLSPARNAECGIEAIRHGADAVYIGGPAFGARAAAGNSIDDIARLCDFAHPYGAKVYVTLNTVLTDEELDRAERIIHDLYAAGVDALIVQDMGVLRLNLPPIALHASTQTELSSPEKARFLEQVGFTQLVLARELSLEEIRSIRQNTTVPLEAFVHGALCVSYSGHCYASQFCFHRSANRGECAQFCRLAFDLVDADGQTLVRDKHLLSLRDMNRSQSLEEMMEAGISSFKIEGRLKDVSYVKNVTAYYRQRIDEVLERHPDRYVRSSQGHSELSFVPRPEKSFNRGFTDYFLHGRTPNIHCFDTPKAIGEYVGRVGRMGRNHFEITESRSTFAGGDGLCYFDTDGKLQGFRINRAEGHTLYPSEMPRLTRGVRLYRNTDHLFEKTLARPSASRKLRASFLLSDTPWGYMLRLSDESGLHVTLGFECEKQPARTPQRDNICKQLTRMGDTPFAVDAAAIDIQLRPLADGSQEHFIPASQLCEWRRLCAEKLLAVHRMNFRREMRGSEQAETRCPETHLTYMDNVVNARARDFYTGHGATDIAPAFEVQPPSGCSTLMVCRHCLRFALGHCPKHHRQPAPWREPLALHLPDGRSFPLHFDCKNCRMEVHSSGLEN